MNKLFNLFEKIFTIISFIHYSGGPLVLILSGGASEGENGDDATFPLISQIFILIYFITFSLLLLRWKKVFSIIIRGGSIWLLFGLAAFSIIWSYSPELTRTRVVALIGTLMFSLYFASRYTLKEQLDLLGWVFGIIVVTSLFYCILLPKYGLMSGVHTGAWRGIYNHKNVLGKIMVLSSVVFLLLAMASKKHRWIFWNLLSGSIILLLLSRSSSSLINLLILVGLFLFLHILFLHILRWNYILIIPTLIGILLSIVILYSFLATSGEQVAGIFGKDLTLTGRTAFWPLILDKILEKPLLGYGFGAFWQGLDGPSAYVWNASAFKAPNSHNGYLDLCLELGLTGLSIYLFKFVSSVQRSIALIRSVRTPDAFWPVLLLSYIVLSNLTESSLVLQNNLLWTLQISTFLSLYRSHSNNVTDPILK
jgi:exopolysaccharide production protein ExoQ